MPNSPHPLDILFLTNFSDYCFRSIPSIAQMADGFAVRLTIMHAYDPEKTSAKQAQEMLDSFFPEADRYRSCRRLAVPCPVVDAVKRHLATWPVNLIIAPSSDPLGLPRLGERSLRARLIEECGVPVWTMGRRVQLPKLLQPVRNVACWLDFHSHGHPHVPFAIEYARRMGANLHLLHSLPVIHEGSLMPAAHQTKALNPQKAASDIGQLCAGASVRPQVHVTHGEGREALSRLLQDCDADLLFLRNDEWFLTRWLGLGLRLGDYMPCPAVYVNERVSVPVWNLEAGPGTFAPVDTRVRARHATAGAFSGLAEIGL